MRPHRVLTQSSERNVDRIYASHPDHLAVGQAAIAAVYPDARNPFAFPELLANEELEPWTVPEVWTQGGPEIPAHARVVVDITDTFDRKCGPPCPRQPDRRREGMRISRSGRSTTRIGGLPEGRLAEVYRRIDTR